MKKTRLISKFIGIILVIMLVGGIGSILIEHYALPFLVSKGAFSKNNFIRRATGEDVTIINKNEITEVREEKSVTEIASRANDSIVLIFSESTLNSLAREPKNLTSGTGFLLTSDGVVVTHKNAVNENADTFRVVINNATHDAKLLGVDTYSDLVFLKIEQENLPAIAIANFDEVSVGQKVLALGTNPNYFSPEYSSGIIESVDKTFTISGKTVSSSEKMDGVFRSKISASQDFNGGALVNLNGELIGITGSVIIDNQNVFFQIPSNQVRSSLEKILSGESKNQPQLGLYYLPITQKIALKYSLPVSEGAYVYSTNMQQGLAVIANSAAQKAGVRVGDIITKIDSDSITLNDSLSKLINRKKSGDEIMLTVNRNGEELVLEATL